MEITYYLQNNELIQAFVKELSPGGIKEAYHFFIFYYEDGKLFYNPDRYTVLPCLAMPRDKSLQELYGYNKSITKEFLNQFLIESIDKIKNHR